MTIQFMLGHKIDPAPDQGRQVFRQRQALGEQIIPRREVDQKIDIAFRALQSARNRPEHLYYHIAKVIDHIRRNPLRCGLIKCLRGVADELSLANSRGRLCREGHGTIALSWRVWPIRLIFGRHLLDHARRVKSLHASGAIRCTLQKRVSPLAMSYGGGTN